MFRAFYSLVGRRIMSLSTEQFQELEQALLAAYPTYFDLKRMLRFTLDELVAALPFSGNLTSAVFTLIETAHARGKADDLARAAHQRNPGNLLLKTYVQKHLAESPQSSGTLSGTTSPDVLEPVGGAVPLGSRFYVARATDEKFLQALSRRDMILTIKGERQMGKTSLLVQGMQCAREFGAKVVLTDFEALNEEQMKTTEALLLTLTTQMARKLKLIFPQERWDNRLGANDNITAFLLEAVLGAFETPLVWCIDETDCLLGHDYCGELFGLFRSWHTERAADPSGPWSRLTLIFSHVNDEKTFISDRNKSPFNVGTRFTLTNFTREEVARLNELYGSPLKEPKELDELYAETTGHPYRTRAAFNELI
jgi:hypothetical protein